MNNEVLLTSIAISVLGIWKNRWFDISNISTCICLILSLKSTEPVLYHFRLESYRNMVDRNLSLCVSFLSSLVVIVAPLVLYVNSVLIISSAKVLWIPNLPIFSSITAILDWNLYSWVEIGISIPFLKYLQWIYLFTRI